MLARMLQGLTKTVASIGAPERALGLGVVVSAALLAGAHTFEAFGYAPCQLCLDQREAHWTALGIGVAGLIAARILKASRAATAAVGALALVYAVSAGLAFYHAGVEWRFWPGPATCAAGGDFQLGDGGLGAALEKGPSGPSCVDAAWRLFDVSMAGYNMLISAALFAICLAAAVFASRRTERQPSEVTAHAS